MMAFLDSHAYGAIFVAVLLDTIGLPVPGEVFLLAAGFLVSAGRVELIPAIALAALGAVLGDTLTFWLGRRVGVAGTRRLVGLYCRWLTCTLGSAHCVERAEGLLRRFRSWVIPVAKFIPGARVFMPPVAAAAAVSYGRFLVLDAAGSLLWTILVVSFGALLGREWEHAARGLEGAYRLLGLELGVLLAGYLVWKLARRCRYGPPRPPLERSVEVAPPRRPACARSGRGSMTAAERWPGAPRGPSRADRPAGRPAGPRSSRGPDRVGQGRGPGLPTGAVAAPRTRGLDGSRRRRPWSRIQSTQPGTWGIGALARLGWLVGMLVLGFAGTAASEERLRAGTKDLTFAAGYSVSHKIGQSGEVETVNGFHLIPHVGYVLTGEHGPGWVRGNFELLAEPTLLYLEDGDSATVGGLAAFGRWVFAGWAGARPYVEVGAGAVGGEVNLRQTTCDVNFLLEGGVGMLFFVSPNTAVTVGYRFHHMSNAQRCSQDLGLNSSLLIVGVSYFFP